MALTAPVKREAFGSTWFGPLEAVQACAKLALSVVEHIYDRERPDEEKKVSNGRERGQAEWTIEHLHLYAGHIALQQCTDTVHRRTDVLEVAASSSRHVDTMVHMKATTDSIPFSRLGFHSDTTQPDVDHISDLDRDVANDLAIALALEANQAVVYLPSDTPKFVKEMLWFHESWVDMISHQPAKWRTDIVVFTDGDLPLWNYLNCTTAIRVTPDEPNRCIVVQGYKKVKSDTFNYGFADSINVVAMESAATAPYDWILRTDIDTFFTPAVLL
ncbi:hypothetical protein H310_03590 [Aphanomyces invadans]|uniref:DUF7164 domain-containing protein n=1 Tax=Aphanomyces invadans TaxID=157072 RepID=A0A024UJD9_9STRA|nr:hypothetical protein H310_03590 [Aphanomyces invadans]ETW05957.1 hypothetical protein H310_03590 [Aphanomyces invadans]|eukprot:XP_008865734.1 hypothetical protein H310_03590 [Aphanomyces invadans]